MHFKNDFFHCCLNWLEYDVQITEVIIIVWHAQAVQSSGLSIRRKMSNWHQQCCVRCVSCQLMNQLNVGPAPAAQPDIDAVPFIRISDNHISTLRYITFHVIQDKVYAVCILFYHFVSCNLILRMQFTVATKAKFNLLSLVSRFRSAAVGLLK